MQPAGCTGSHHAASLASSGGHYSYTTMLKTASGHSWVLMQGGALCLLRCFGALQKMLLCPSTVAWLETG
jgi:hypothetical protein